MMDYENHLTTIFPEVRQEREKRVAASFLSRLPSLAFPPLAQGKKRRKKAWREPRPSLSFAPQDEKVPRDAGRGRRACLDDPCPAGPVGGAAV